MNNEISLVRVKREEIKYKTVMIPVYPKDIEIFKKFIIGKPELFELKAKRNGKHNSLYWIKMGALAYHIGCTDVDLHEYFKSRIIKPEYVSSKLGQIQKRKSTSFLDMNNEKEFRDYDQKVDEIVINAGYDIDQIMKDYTENILKG
jgi:hypothetical protein